jgi:hypothetical protein
MSTNMLEDLLGSDSEHTAEFFANELQSVVRRTQCDQNEMLYVASVLAHYASTPCVKGRPLTLAINESAVPFAFTRTELSPYLYARLSPNHEPLNAEDFENKGSYIFLMIGFFRRQMEYQNNVVLYEKIAQGYYHQAHQYIQNETRKQFLRKFSYALPFWSNACAGLNKVLREKRFILQLD